jgi:hypothetical protein
MRGEGPGVRANDRKKKRGNKNEREEKEGGREKANLALFVGDVDGREDPDIYRVDLGRGQKGHMIPARPENIVRSTNELKC